MRLVNRVAVLNVWLALLVGSVVCSLSIAALAVEFQPPSRGIPGRREGAGTRGSCISGSVNLTALLPQTNLGLTTAEYPRFFWYVPKTNATTATFSLFQGNEQDPTQTQLYETTLTLTGEAGVQSVALPKTDQISPLALGKDYYWSITLNCNADDPIGNPHTGGWVQRIQPSLALEKQLANANVRDRVQLYAQNGIWFETVSTLANLRCTNPNDKTLLGSWSELLRSVKLNKIIDQPLTGKCGK